MHTGDPICRGEEEGRRFTVVGRGKGRFVFALDNWNDLSTCLEAIKVEIYSCSHDKIRIRGSCRYNSCGREGEVG